MDKIEVLIKKSLEHFDEQNKNNAKLLQTKLNFTYDVYITKDDEEEIEESDPLIAIDQSTYEYECLAIFDTQTKTWIWSWCKPIILRKLVMESKYLLNYGLNLNPRNEQEDFYYLKVMLVNSRIFVEDEYQLEIMLAISSYLLGNRIKCIYRQAGVKKNKEEIIYFYLIK